MTDQTQPAVWIDGDPLMEAIAAAVWEHCRTEGTSLVVDDPRNIAAVAASAIRSQQAGRAAVLREAAEVVAALDPVEAALAGQFAYHDAATRLHRLANEAEYAAIPCDSMVPCEDGGEPCHVHERLMSHYDGSHELCGPECDGTVRPAAKPPTDTNGWPGDEHAEPGTRGWTV